ncbi:putative disease resistance RPP13-like protein 1 isoform X1 [Cucumis melo var. makuwa]|uniref:Disease resistance RPP13-like protein 1 isoform X1 n=1 Tax=Cucumis melo var. makuwa TaxID=1194695 RepID=A0A5A7UTU8_CUCMM|nr:putative disease resistance RPP13-like protein 1 isoform X1 [Cucumis melo var. makuwa]
MAEAILYNFTADIIFKLGSSALQELGSLWRVNSELHKLKHSLSAIQAVLHDAEEQQSKNNQVKDWVLKLQDVLYEIDDLIDESSYETLRRQVLAKHRRYRKQVRILFSKFKSNWKIGHKIKEIRERLQAINEDKNQFGFCKHVIERRDDYEGLRKRRETHSFIPQDEVVGRNDDKEAVIDLLLNSNTKEDIAIVSIVGMGGLGKTALAQSIYNHHSMTNDGQFQMKLWVCVSEEFDLKIIIQKIIESATKKKPKSFLQIDSLQHELRKQIDGKKYLLVMDDVWNEKKEEWLNLKKLLMGGAKGSRILITTRSEQVAKTFDSTFVHLLQILDTSNSWLLFQKMTGLEGRLINQEAELDQKNSNLIKIGMEIVSMLNGVPLVIRNIGGLLKDNKSERFWLSFKDKELHQVLRQEQDALKEMQLILELSYKYLPSSNLKQCFRYCALFPKDYKIQKDELILLWRAQGFIQPNGNNDDDNYLVDIGDDYFMQLLSRSFFQEVEKDALGEIITCKMHDLMHDLACSIANHECVRGLKGNDIDKRTRHFFLEGGSRENQLMGHLSKAKYLRTFFRQDHYGVYSQWKNFKEIIFCNIFRLRAWHSQLIGGIEDVESLEFIAKLKHLRYLRMKNCSVISTDLLDCIMKLYNLETFIFQSRGLKSLPNTIGNLINLKHLDLSYNVNLGFLPDSITELCKLEALILRSCRDLKGLPKEIKNCYNLRRLDLSNNWSIEFIPDSIAQLINLETLILSYCRKLKKLPEDTKNLVKLKHLDLQGCLAVTHMPKGLGELTNLQIMNTFVLGNNKGGELKELDGLTKLRGKLSIEHLEFCTSIVDQQMKSKFLQLMFGLQELKLHWEKHNGELEDVIYESVLDCLQPHSNLQKIYIDGYGGVNLCNWVSSKFLGCLVTMRLCNCERLRHLPRFDQFPNLKHLYLVNLLNIEYIIVNNDDSISSSTNFPSLEILSISRMPKLVSWCKGTSQLNLL